MIADLWNTLQQDPFYKDQTTIFITVDHGRGEEDRWKDHNNKIPFSDEIWFAVLGPDSKPVGEIKTVGQLYQNQFAKTIAALLGITFAADHPTGEPVLSVLNNGQ
jgi:hypothetical protein